MKELISNLKKPSVPGNILKLLGYILFSCLLLFAAARCIVVFLPFVIGLCISAILDRPLHFLQRKLRLSSPLAAGIGVAFVTVLVCGLVAVIVIRIYAEARDLIIQLPSLYTKLMAFLESALAYIAEEYEWVTPEVIDTLQELLSSHRSSLLVVVNNITRGAWNTAISTPQIFIGCIAALFSTFFFLRDKEKLLAFFEKQLPKTWHGNIQRTRKDLFKSLFGYIRGILLLSLISFVELTIGFSVLKVEYGVAIALFCAVLDALPAIGTGWVLTPWGIISLIMGNVRLGVGLLVMYIIVFVVRQILEPRIMGGQINMYPLVLLFAMYFGMQFMGILGLLLGQLCAIALRSLLRFYIDGRTFEQVLYEGVEVKRGPDDE